jgi:hypothetical protein
LAVVFIQIAPVAENVMLEEFNWRLACSFERPQGARRSNDSAQWEFRLHYGHLKLALPPTAATPRLLGTVARSDSTWESSSYTAQWKIAELGAFFRCLLDIGVTALGKPLL